jgi:endonuclease YncB( thermonuclease family)
MRINPRSVLAALAISALVAACGGDEARRYNRKKAQKSLRSLETPGVTIGEFTLARRAVIDGDTVRVDGLESTLRLLAIDTEETFKNKTDRRKAGDDFFQYLRDKRGGGRKPVKAATPLGEDAKKFAKKFFDGVRTVRLERDHPKEIRGRYNRYLAYVLAPKNGKWVNYNVECVRAGMSPYFTKYGYSRRFHDEFVAAEKEARAAKRGIWAPDAQHYTDYDERLKWWHKRAEFIKQFEKDARGRDNYIVLTNWDSILRIERHLDKEVVILATVGKIRIGDRGPTKVMLSRRLKNDFPLIFFDKDVFGSSGIARFKGEFVRVRGVVNKYRNKYTKREVLQIIVNTPGQIVGNEIPGITDATRSAAAQ